MGDGLCLKSGVGPALAGVPSCPLHRPARRMGEAVEEGHLIGQAEAGEVGLVLKKLQAVSLHPNVMSFKRLLHLKVLGLVLDAEGETED